MQRNKENKILIEKEDAYIAHENAIVDNKEESIFLQAADKPIFNYPKSDGTCVSFRESKTEFAPKAEEFHGLRKTIFRTLGRKTTPEFDDKISYLITFLREQAYINITTISITNRRKGLLSFEDQLEKLVSFMDDDSFDHIQDDLGYEVMKMMSETGSEDPVYLIYQNAKNVAEMCKKTSERLKGQKRSFTPNTMRQILAEELARELNKMGETPKKYRDGNYFKILKAILEIIPCIVHGERISISIPQNLFKMASKAIDDYPEKEPFALLNFD